MDQNITSHSYGSWLISLGLGEKNSTINTDNSVDNFFMLIDKLSRKTNASRRIFAIEQYWNNKPAYQPLTSETKIMLDKTRHILNKHAIETSIISNYLYNKRLEAAGISFNNLSELEKHIEKTEMQKELLIAQLNGFSSEATDYLRKQIEALYIIRVIKNLDQDSLRGCFFVPRSFLIKYGMKYPNSKNAYRYPAAFRELIESLIIFCSNLMKEAEGIKDYVPKVLRKEFEQKLAQFNREIKNIFSNPFILFESNKPEQRRFNLVNLIKGRF